MAHRISPRLSWRLLVVAAFLPLVLAVADRRLSAQRLDASTLRQPTDLDMPWLVHGGDDPAYAQPGFDDSEWRSFDPNTAIKHVIPGEPEIVWYRLHVKVARNQTDLALSEYYLAKAFEVYVNGERLMKVGQVAPFVPYALDTRLLKPIPDRLLASGSFVIALRVHISRTEWSDLYAGYYATNLTLGEEADLREHIQLVVIGQYALFAINTIFGLGLGIVALALYSSQRTHREYLWIFLQFFIWALQAPLTLYTAFRSVPVTLGLIGEPLHVAALICQVLMYLAILRMAFNWWLRVFVAVSVVGLVISVVGTAQGSLSRAANLAAQTPILLLTAVILPVVLIWYMRRGNSEAGILLIPALLSSLTIYTFVGIFVIARVPAFEASANRFGSQISHLHAGPFLLDFDATTGLFYALSLAVIMVLRSTRISRQQAFIESELEAAREVQQVILPDQIETVPGFTVESIYEPAQQVGGDFFQVLPAPDGAVLVVVGDVAGKGLPAAMLVSVLVGATRGVAEYTSDPAELLSSLNERLIGRTSGGFSTALAAHISAHGMVEIANAGHLWPYLDGREMELPGELPLGIKSGARYETVKFQLPAGSRLTFYSDGIVEAQNQKGEMLGFERSRELSTQPVTKIVEAAKKFGQQDDMTVIAISRDRAVASAA